MRISFIAFVVVLLAITVYVATRTSDVQQITLLQTYEACGKARIKELLPKKDLTTGALAMEAIASCKEDIKAVYTYLVGKGRQPSAALQETQDMESKHIRYFTDYAQDLRNKAPQP